MKQDEIKKHSPPPFDKKPFISFPRITKAEDFSTQICDFLDKYLRGAYEIVPYKSDVKHVKVSATGFAFATRVIFKSVMSRERISISFIPWQDALSVKFTFSTSYLDEAAIGRLEWAAESSDFVLQITESSVTFTMEAFDFAITTVYSGRSPIFFHALLDAWRDEIPLPPPVILNPKRDSADGKNDKKP